MASVTSLTEERIQELMAGWVAVGLSQDEINSLLVQLRAAQEIVDTAMAELNEQTLPQLQQQLADNDIRVGDLNDNVLPDLEQNLSQAQLAIDNMATVTVPAIQQDLNATIQNSIDRPKVYVQPDAPTNPDDDDRYLVVGDTWFDSDDQNKQLMWNGVEWSTFAIEIADFSLTVKKLISPRHQLY